MKKILTLFALFTIHCSLFTAFAQVTLNPGLPTINSTITVYFNAAAGNTALINWSGTVYMHTGLITSTSTSTSDWQYTQDTWGTADAATAMTYLGNNIYSKTFNIQTFYGVPATGVTVLDLAFVFRDVTGNTVGRNSSDGDIIVPINATTLSNYVSNTFKNNKLTVFATNGKLTVEPYAGNMAKIAIYPSSGDTIPDTSCSVIMTPSKIPANLTVSANYLELNCGKMTVHINMNPVQLSFINNGTTVLSEETGYFSTSSEQGLRFKISPTDCIYGTGSRATPINKNGQTFYSYNTANYDYTYPNSTLNINIPFIMSSAGYGLYIENRTAGTFDIGNLSDSLYQYTAESGKLSYYVMTGPAFDTILNTYTNLTGKQPLPPRWGLGYLQSRFGYVSWSDAMSKVTAILAAGYPLDAIILDVYWFGNPAQTYGNMGDLTWNTSTFPNSQQQMSTLKSMGINTILITEPYVTEASINYNYCNSNLLFGRDQATGKFTYVVDDFFAGAAGLLDITHQPTREWIWGKYKALADQGVNGWWCDVIEPEDHPLGMLQDAGTTAQIHNVFALSWEQMLYNNYRKAYPDVRLFNLTRSGYAGMQRYSTFLWSGDVDRSFAGLDAQIPIMLGMSMSGVGYMSSDLGGFVNTGTTEDPELYTRWLQYGAFTPVFRPHSQMAVAPEPCYYPTANQVILRYYIKLRYQLMPYNYTLSWQNSTTGRPLAMPINYFEPTNSSIANVNDEYLWGPSFLVAPVLSAGQTTRNVLFPSGKWINYYTPSLTYAGNTTATNVNAPLNQMPLYVKAGSFIPTVPVYYHTRDYNTDTLLISYYADISSPNTSLNIYDDDGQTPNANLTGQNQIITFTGKVSSDEIDIHLATSGNGYTGMPTSRRMMFKVFQQTTAPSAVFIDGKQITISPNYQAYLTTDTAAFYSDTSDVVYVQYPWKGGNDLIVISDNSSYTGITNPKSETSSFYLQYPYPNPFTTYTTISYNILQEGNYSLDFYTAEGRLIQSLNYNLASGSYTYNWYGTDNNNSSLASGVYIVSLSGPTGKQYMKVVKQN